MSNEKSTLEELSNAELIMACNLINDVGDELLRRLSAHDALVEALESSVIGLQSAAQWHYEHNNEYLAKVFRDKAEIARAALKLAGKE